MKKRKSQEAHGANFANLSSVLRHIYNTDMRVEPKLLRTISQNMELFLETGPVIDSC